jgi:hypothetical protein
MKAKPKGQKYRNLTAQGGAVAERRRRAVCGGVEHGR